MADRTVFLHLPKTGGTTLHQLLSGCFAPNRICPARLDNLEDVHAAEGSLEHYRLFSGHYSYDSVLRHIPGPRRFVTLLREPRARLLSQYYFFRSHRLEYIMADPVRTRQLLPARQLGLAEYLEREGRSYRDLMVTHLAGTDGSDSERLQRAIERLGAMLAVGLTERMEESVHLIFSRLGLPIPAGIPRAMSFDTLATELAHIERIEKEPVTAEIERQLDELTVLDRELYAAAVELFEKQLSGRGVAAPPPVDLRTASELRVLYDVSVLGYGQMDNRCRTGVYRAIENIARQLCDSNAIDLAFCATQSWRALDGSCRYLEAHRDLYPGVPLVGAVPFTEVYRGLTAIETSLGALSPASDTEDLHPDAPAFFANLHDAVSRTVRVYGDMARTVGVNDVRGFDICHSTFYPVPRHLRRAPGVTMFATVYDLIPLLLPELFAGQGNNEVEFQRMVDTVQALTAGDHVLCISNSVRDDLLGFAPLDPDKIHVTHLAANPAVFYPVSDPAALAAVRARYGIGEGPYMLGVSTLEPRKNFDHLIRCYVRLVQEERLPDLRLVVVGAKGWNYGPIFEELRRAGLPEDRVVFTGYVPDAELAPLYSGALAFVYPSLYEGFGLPPLEAMQCGTPVITSNNSSLPEVVGEAGIMVDPRDADALCAAMLRLYRDGGLRADLARRSRERAALFTWERTAEQTIAAYRMARV